MDRLKTAIALAALASVGCGGGGGEESTEEPAFLLAENSDRLIQWVGADDGILVQDLNGDGHIQQNEFFGSRMMTGRDIDNGFEDLALLDCNGDGVLEPISDLQSALAYPEWRSLADAIRGLRIWRDSNGNAAVDSGELAPLAETRIQIYLGYRDSSDETIRQVGWSTTEQQQIGPPTFGCAWLKSERLLQEGEATEWNRWAVTIVDLDGDGIEVRPVPFGTGYPVKSLWVPATETIQQDDDSSGA